MRRWIGWIGRLYPGRWRARYGAEFDALLEDVTPDWRELLNVAGGAVRMQLANGSAWKWVAGAAAAGMLVAAALSFVVGQRYVSSAVLRVTAVQRGSYSPDRTAEMTQAILSRTSLVDLIHKLDLYKAERAREPMNDVVDRMRRDLSIRLVNQGPDKSLGRAFQISFAYPDRGTAQAVVRMLVTRLIEQNLWDARFRDTVWKDVWHEDLPPSEREVLEVLDPASLPQKAIVPNRLVFLACGLGAGLLVGVLAMLLRRRPRAVLRLAGWAAAGCFLAGGFSFADRRPVRLHRGAADYACSETGTMAGGSAGRNDPECRPRGADEAGDTVR